MPIFEATQSSDRHLAAIVLAAGKGVRMRSATPKVLHRIAGRSIIEWVLAAVRGAGISQSCLVLGPEQTGFEEFLRSQQNLTVVLQPNRLGTGDAVASAALAFENVTIAKFAAAKVLRGDKISASHVLVCIGDIPGLRSETLGAFLQSMTKEKAHLGVLGMDVAEPRGYGRLVLDSGGTLQRIVEEKDADAATKKITICNTGIFFADSKLLFELVSGLTTANTQGEYLLTDCVQGARARGLTVKAHVADREESRDFLGVNDRFQMAQAEHTLIRRHIAYLMGRGVTIRLPETVYAEPTVSIGPDSEIESGCWLAGRTKIGSGCHIKSGARLVDATIGNGVIVGGRAVLEQWTVPDTERNIAPGSVRLGDKDHRA